MARQEFHMVAGSAVQRQNAIPFHLHVPLHDLQAYLQAAHVGAELDVPEENVKTAAEIQILMMLIFILKYLNDFGK